MLLYVKYWKYNYNNKSHKHAENTIKILPWILNNTRYGASFL